MNYCHACRRHLNGALACAGCGTPAEYLIPAASGAGPASVPAAETPYSGPPPALAEVFADSLVVLSAPNERRPGARRRVTHRRRRRTVLSLSLGLLIAVAGSMAVVRMATDAERTDRASTVVLTDDGPQQPAPLPDAPTGGAPTGPGRVTAKATVAGTKPAGAAAPSGNVPQPGPTSPAPAPETSGPASRTPGPGPTVRGTASGKPSSSASTSTRGPSPSSTAPVPPPVPTKEPCGFFDFGCWF
ncbi:SCO2400 family protein [Streptomyces sp. NPDC054840]